MSDSGIVCSGILNPLLPSWFSRSGVAAASSRHSTTARWSQAPSFGGAQRSQPSRELASLFSPRVLPAKVRDERHHALGAPRPLAPAEADGLRLARRRRVASGRLARV